MAMEILAVVVTPINEVGKWLCGKLKREISYLTTYNENLANLQTQVSELQARRNDVQNQLDEGGRRLEEPEQTVKVWLENTDNILELVANLNQEAANSRRCLKGLCPDLLSRRRFSKQALDKLNDAKELNAKVFQRISHVVPPPDVQVVHKDLVQGLTSRDLMKNKVMGALHDKSIKSIGIYGMGGSGKTTLVDTINNELRGSKIFNKVIKVTVSQSPDLKTIQNQIANRLGLTFPDQDNDLTRANKLSDRLTKEEPVLLILDDLWGKLDVAIMGIPCRFIITTRSFDVCIQMNIKTRVEMVLLPEKEAWTLFEEKVGEVVRRTDLQPIAENIVRRCKGSPLAIVTLGSTLREEKSISQWRYALKALEDPSQGDVQGVMQEVAVSLKFSYDHLHGLYGRGIQLCFLFCCLFPEDFNIHLSDLRNYGIGEGFLNVNGSLQDASDKLSFYIGKLKNCGLLLEGDEPWSVKLHDVVRVVALWIAAEDENGFLANVGKISRNWSEVEKLKVYRRISFMNVKETMKLSVEPECPQLKLSTLLLRENNDMGIDQEGFFEMMKTLVVLNMQYKTWAWKRSLVPHSFASLTNLRTLYLERYDLSSNVSVLGKMRKLEILCLRGSKIGALPEEMGNLTSLRCLDLTGAELSSVATNVFSRLMKLEELYVWNEFDGWNKEVVSLPNLTGLEIRVRDEFFQDVSLSWNNLEHFDVGRNNSVWKLSNAVEKHRSEKENSLHIGRGNPIGHCAIKLLSKLTHKLALEDCHGFDNVGDVYEKAGFKQVKILKVISCDGIENLISIEEESRDALQDSFQCLEELHLEDLKNMKILMNGKAADRVLGQLRGLKVYECPKLKNVLPCDLLLPVGRLEKLEYLDVSDCEALSEVFKTEEVGEPLKGESSMLSGLKQLRLNGLPELRSIWKGRMPIGSLQSLQLLKLENCPVIKYCFSSSSSIMAEGLPNLCKFEISGCEGMEKLVGEEEVTREASSEITLFTSAAAAAAPPFQNLLYLNIDNCKGLKKLFSLSLARGLHQLQELWITTCPNLEEIFSKEEEEEEAVVTTEASAPPFQNLRVLDIRKCKGLTKVLSLSFARGLHQLKKIHIRDCPNLEEIFYKEEEEAVVTTEASSSPPFQNLRYLEIKNCKGLKKVLSLSLARGLHQLETLEIWDCRNLEEMFYKEEEEKEAGSSPRFQNLRVLDIRKCQGLKKVFSLSLARGLHQLQKLYIWDCPNLEEMFYKEEEKKSPAFQNLRVLDIRKCQGLKKVFSLNLARGLHQLEKIDIRDCLNLEEIFYKEEEAAVVTTEASSPPIQNLRHLKIKNCKGLKKVLSLSLARCLHQLESLEIWDCPNLEEIFYKEEEEEEAVVATETSAPPFQNLRVLEIRNCKGLKKLFSLSLARGLHQLAHLSIYDCPNLKEIFYKEEEEAAAVVDKDLLPLLQSLWLILLPKVRCMYYEQGTNFPPLLFGGHHLQYVEVRRCPKLTRLPLHPRCASTTLKVIKASKEWFEELLWDDETSKSLFQPFCIFTHWKEDPKPIGWPEKVKHVLHTEHHLLLYHRLSYVCDGCPKNGEGRSYYCEDCDFGLHPKCALEHDDGKSAKYEVGEQGS